MNQHIQAELSQAGPALSTCHTEPIRIPGSIQPHGMLLCLTREMHLAQFSENVPQLLDRAVETLLGRPLANVLGDAAANALQRELAATSLRRQPSYLTTVLVAGRTFDVLAHDNDGLTLLEFEPTDRPGAADFRHLAPLLGDFLLKMNEVAGVEAMSDLAAREIAAVTGYGRVLVYRFDEDGHGRVLAECRQEGYQSFLEQRFPASDIPAQARELYALNRIRLIHDANYTPARLLPQDHPLTGRPNDLSYAALRSVSPVHLQYMRNMGTLASMSISLMVNGKLWGLISCHNAQPRHVPYEQRSACEQLAQVLALRIESREQAEDYNFRLDVRRSMINVVAGLTQGADFIDNMRSVFPELLRFARASGAAILVDDRIACYGDTPTTEQIQELVNWLDHNEHGDMFHTEHLSHLYPSAVEFTRNASGLLAMPISRIHKHYLLWFRPEQVHTVLWAGNPHAKAAPTGTANLSSIEAANVSGLATQPAVLTPRTSFDTWRETVHGTSTRWHAAELELALEFRTALLGIALERAEEMAALAEELGRANKELEAFSYSVSHDLRAPLRHIVGFSDLLMESGGNEDVERRLRFLGNIKDAARLAGKLVDDLLSFSQMGRAALHPVPVDLRRLVQTCIDKLALEIGSRKIEWHVENLPRVQADPAFLQLALYNLLSNAVKFTSEQPTAIIRVSGTESAEAENGLVQIDISDNGVGFNMAYVHKLFGVFQRLHRLEDFSGTGIGLANVRRIIERHGGKAWASSAPSKGATFSFSLPKALIPAEK